jgi:hypothetical protein
MACAWTNEHESRTPGDCWSAGLDGEWIGGHSRAPGPRRPRYAGPVTQPAGELRALSAVLAWTAGKAALRRGLPMYAAVFIASVMIFAGKYAMRASEPVSVARHSLAFRAALLLAWLILALPVARAWLVSPSARFVRVFPVRWTSAALVLAAGLLVIEAPWIILWSRGGGALAGTWAALVAAGGHALVLGRPRRWYELLAAALWGAALVLGPGLPLLLALPALVTGCRRAWIDGVEGTRVRPARAWVTTRSPVLALACAHLASLLRRQRPLLLRWLWLAALALGSAVLAIRNNDFTAPPVVSLVCLMALTPVTIANALAVAAAYLRGERRAQWLLDVTGTPAGTRLLAAALALAVPGLLFGLAHGVLVALLTGGTPRVWTAAAAAGAGLGLLGALAARWADRGSGQDAGRFVTAGMTISVVVIALAVWRGEAGVGLALVALAALARLLPVPRRPASVETRTAEDQD